MQQGIGAAIQLSISEETSLVSSIGGSNGGGIGGTKETGASHSPGSTSAGDAVDKASPKGQRKSRYSVL
jgi:hypothetical protein